MGVEGPEEKARYIWSLGIANIIYMGIGIRNIHTSFWVAHIIKHAKLTGLVTSHDDAAHHHSDHLTLLTLATSSTTLDLAASDYLCLGQHHCLKRQQLAVTPPL